MGVNGAVECYTNNDQRSVFFVNYLAFNVGIREKKVGGDWKEGEREKKKEAV